MSMAHFANGRTTLMFEGSSHLPDRSQVLSRSAKAQGQSIYTLTPTAIRASDGQSTRLFVRMDATCSSLKLLRDRRSNEFNRSWELVTDDVVAKGIAPSSIRLCGRPKRGVTLWDRYGRHIATKPARDEKPFFVFKPAVVLGPGQNGCRDCTGMMSRVFCCIADSWPGQMRTNLGPIMKRFDADPISAIQRLLLLITGDEGVGRDRGRRELIGINRPRGD